MAPAAGAEVPYWRDLLRVDGYPRLFLASLGSSLGDWAGVTAAIALVARQGQGPEAASGAITLVMLARLVPALTLGPIAGVLVDRVDRRRLMVGADLGRAALYGALPLLPGVWAIALASAAIEALSSVWGPSRDAGLPSFVPDRLLPQANVASFATAYGTLPIGSAIFVGSLALAPSSSFLEAHPEAAALWFDSITFLFSAWMVAGVTALSAPASSADERGVGFATALREGLGFMRANRTVRSLTIGLMLVFAGVGAVTVLAPVFVRFELGGDEATFGLIVTAVGIGMLLAAVSVPRVARAAGWHRAFHLAVAAGAVSLGLLAIVPSPGWAIAVGFPLGAAAGLAWAFGTTGLQELVPDELRGRTFGAVTAASRVAVLSGRVLLPALATLIAGLGRGISGPRSALAVAALLAGVAAWASSRS